LVPLTVLLTYRYRVVTGSRPALTRSSERPALLARSEPRPYDPRDPMTQATEDPRDVWDDHGR